MRRSTFNDARIITRCSLLILLLLSAQPCFCWGFYAHKKINQLAVFLLPPEMIVLYKPHIGFLTDHAVDPDKRRYAIPEEGPRHYIDIDHYGAPYDSIPRLWKDAVAKYSTDTLMAYGIVPWWLQTMLFRLTDAFRDKDQARILKYSAEIGHYIADSHVPLHATKNHNGQYTNQRGIHGFWESRVPELLAEKEWDFFIGKAIYIKRPTDYFWKKVLESSAAADTVLLLEKELSQQFPADRKYAYELQNGRMIRQYSSEYTRAYDKRLKGMVERRMRESILSVASCWFTAWVNAGQPDLTRLTNTQFSTQDLADFEELNNAWLHQPIKGREH